jgi:hypothetical protein
MPRSLEGDLGDHVSRRLGTSESSARRAFALGPSDQRAFLLIPSACVLMQDALPAEFKVTLAVHHASLLRNKRCLLAYMQVRAADAWPLTWWRTVKACTNIDIALALSGHKQRHHPQQGHCIGAACHAS